ncbi:hypothetical protein UCDDS831_g02901 [Diplodia seriata]|uniref:Uncharacterized protein n=1 Tax=Diplodia seriata TaxID=420778 RepID=A0A0G2H4K1_9PEZI|nr:hypothetical protein UCDDS831_g02901 [Diplodia seriata]
MVLFNRQQQQRGPLPAGLASPQNLLLNLTLSPSAIEQPRSDQTNLYRIDEGWRICVETFTNLQTITLDGRNIGDLEKNVKTFAGWGGFPSLSILA